MALSRCNVTSNMYGNDPGNEFLRTCTKLVSSVQLVKIFEQQNTIGTIEFNNDNIAELIYAMQYAVIISYLQYCYYYYCYSGEQVGDGWQVGVLPCF